MARGCRAMLHRLLQAGSKAKHMIDAGVAEACRARCADLLARHPLYPQIQL